MTLEKDKHEITPTPTDVILESISDGVFTIDLNWRITSFNRAAEAITGIPKKEALGQLCSEVFRSSMCGESCALHETIRTGKPIVGRTAYIITAEGNQIPISISTAVLRNEKGEIIGGVETFRDLSEIEALRKELKNKFHLGDLVSRSPIMHRLFEVLPSVATSPSTVLLVGETGTGKEVFARTIHSLSPRSQGPFVAVNSAALPDSLLESELFGYKAGAFTGATRDKPGRFALAHKGTLFLDEIGDIPLAMQAKLLRVLQEREFEPLGAIQSQHVDVRIIAATNKDLNDMVKKGQFREDLYYRINVIRLELPPLRERKEDIPLLVEEFISHLNRIQNKNIEGVSAEALSFLMAYNWPGNIRELENVIERAFVVCSDKLIQLEHLPPELTATSPKYTKANIREVRNTMEAEFILSTLRRNNFNRAQTAKELGIHKTTLLRKIKRYKLKLPLRASKNKT